MTTRRKATSNRNNSVHSTGPRTASGKKSSSRNAVKHGLASRVAEADALDLASLLIGGDASDLEHREVVAAAEAILTLRRVSSVRTALINARVRQRPSANEEQQDSAALAVVADMAPELLRLDEYDRKALSRFRKALRRIGQTERGV